jgi:hypothetical protein
MRESQPFVRSAASLFVQSALQYGTTALSQEQGCRKGTCALCCRTDRLPWLLPLP